VPRSKRESLGFISDGFGVGERGGRGANRWLKRLPHLCWCSPAERPHEALGGNTPDEVYAVEHTREKLAA